MNKKPKEFKGCPVIYKGELVDWININKENEWVDEDEDYLLAKRVEEIGNKSSAKKYSGNMWDSPSDGRIYAPDWKKAHRK